MNAEMVFDRYEGENRQRCVFAENPLTTGAENVRFGDDFDLEFQRRKFDNWRANIEFYLGVRPCARKQKRASPAGSFERQLHQIRFKSKANGTELPRLEFDFAKREIGFEWRSMFDRFCSEAVLLQNRERGVLAESEQWLYDGKHSIAGALAFSKATKVARESIAKEVRRGRIKKWRRGNLDFEFKEAILEVEADDSALSALKQCEMSGDFMHCAEDCEERLIAELMQEYHEDREVFTSEYTDMYDDFSDDENSAEKCVYDTMWYSAATRLS